MTNQCKVYKKQGGDELVIGYGGLLTRTDSVGAFKIGVGSVSGTQAADGDLTSTEQGIIPATTIDTQSNTVLTNALKAALAASAQFDGTSLALDMYVNAAILNASTSKAATVAITGTLTFYWINLGDC